MGGCRFVGESLWVPVPVLTSATSRGAPTAPPGLAGFTFSHPQTVKFGGTDLGITPHGQGFFVLGRGGGGRRRSVALPEFWHTDPTTEPPPLPKRQGVGRAHVLLRDTQSSVGGALRKRVGKRVCRIGNGRVLPPASGQPGAGGKGIPNRTVSTCCGGACGGGGLDGLAAAEAIALGVRGVDGGLSGSAPFARLFWGNAPTHARGLRERRRDRHAHAAQHRCPRLPRGSPTTGGGRPGAGPGSWYFAGAAGLRPTAPAPTSPASTTAGLPDPAPRGPRPSAPRHQQTSPVVRSTTANGGRDMLGSVGFAPRPTACPAPGG